MRNLQEQAKKAFYYQKLFTVWINCYRDIKFYANSQPSASNVKSFSWSLEHFFLIVGQNNFDNKIPFLVLHSLVIWTSWYQKMTFFLFWQNLKCQKGHFNTKGRFFLEWLFGVFNLPKNNAKIWWISDV